MSTSVFEESMTIKTYFRALLDIVFPPRCFSCDRDIFTEKKSYICEDCLKNIRYVGENRCLICGYELEPFVSASDGGCTRCRGFKVMFDGASYAAKFEGVIRELIHRFKYNYVDFLAEPLVEILINHLSACNTQTGLNLNNLKKEVDVVVPVPLFWWRRFKRGFNQSELLAKKISKHLLLPVSTNNLYRIRNTIPQIKLSRTERQQNMRGAFALKRTEEFKKRRVLLIDDVLTTGVTASECARVIKAAGGEKVYVLTIAGAGF